MCIDCVVDECLVGQIGQNDHVELVYLLAMCVCYVCVCVCIVKSPVKGAVKGEEEVGKRVRFATLHNGWAAMMRGCAEVWKWPGQCKIRGT